VSIVWLLLVGCVSAIPVSVMMNLDLFNASGLIGNELQLRSRLSLLKQQGVQGVMVDVWWGLVETAPAVYNWKGYRRFVDIVANAGGLTIQVRANRP
jgi:beta-amylase